MEAYVLDTSLFTNPETYTQFGENSQAAIATFLDLAQDSGARFYMPSSVYRELKQIKDLGALAAQFEAVVRLRSPRKSSLAIPAEILYEFIEEVRTRIDRGLKVAEEHARLGSGEGVDAGAVINRLRERYRETLRQGIIDSREDVDVLLLAFELDATVVTADEGLRRWADKVGVQWVTCGHFRQVLEALGRIHRSERLIPPSL